jgi:mRNA-degrading endonuclease RelE of RelBE toxin-antitoxin system
MRSGRIALVFAIGLVLAGLAHAQPRPGGGRGGFGLVRGLGTNEALQKELKLDKDEIDKVKTALTKVGEETRDEQRKLFGQDATEEEKKEIRSKINAAYDKAIGAILTADQMKRLHQLENQQAGLEIFISKEDTKKALKISDKQEDSIKEINDELQKDIRELFPRGGPGGGGGGGRPDPDAQKKATALRKDAMDRVTKLLSDSQNSTLKDLLGATADASIFQPQGGGGGFGPGGGTGFFQQPGQIMSDNMKERLKLTDDQKKQLEDLQKEIDAKLEKILSDDQKKTMKEPPQFGRPGGGGRNPGQ